MGPFLSLGRREEEFSCFSLPCTEANEISTSPTPCWMAPNAASSLSQSTSTPHDSDNSTARGNEIVMPVQLCSSPTLPTSCVDADNTLPSSSLETVVHSFQLPRHTVLDIQSKENCRNRKRLRSDLGGDEKGICSSVHLGSSSDVCTVVVRSEEKRRGNLLLGQPLLSPEGVDGALDRVNAEKNYGCHGHLYGTQSAKTSHGLALVWSLSSTPLTALTLLTLCRVGSNARKKIMLVDEVSRRGVLLAYQNDF